MFNSISAKYVAFREIVRPIESDRGTLVIGDDGTDM